MFVTDREIAQTPALADLQPEQLHQVLADTERVYRHVRRNEWIGERDLREYGQRNQLPPDRLNAAVQVLKATGRLHDIPEADR